MPPLFGGGGKAGRDPATPDFNEPLVSASLISQGLGPPTGHLCSVHSLLKSLPPNPVLSLGMTKTCSHPRQTEHWSLFVQAGTLEVFVIYSVDPGRYKFSINENVFLYCSK